MTQPSDIDSINSDGIGEAPRALTGFFTDHYELTMLQAALKSGAAHRQTVFEVFARSLPNGRRYGVVAGTARLLEGLKNFRFTKTELDFLSNIIALDDATLAFLEDYRFTGSISGYREGELYFPYSPVLTVESTFAQACVLETYFLSVLNHDSAIASAASRMVTAAQGRPCIEMGSRRTHEEAAAAAARAAIIAGFDSTSNLQAGLRYQLKTTGTAAHSFTLLHDSETAAFRAQLDALGKGTTLLVDTYNVRDAVTAAVDLAGHELGAVRLDSGDLVAQAQQVRNLLDDKGNTTTKIIVTSDLDEYAIAALAVAPVDGYGVGTSLVTGSGAPAAGMVYKLVSRQDDYGKWIPTTKMSANKMSHGGRKSAVRRRNGNGTAVAEVIGVGFDIQETGHDRPLTVRLVDKGEVLHGFVGPAAVRDAREHHRFALAEMPAAALQLQKGVSVIPTEFLNATYLK